MDERTGNNSQISIDESTHREVPSFKERATNAAIAVLLGLILYHIIGFWVFPGLGWFALRPLASYGVLSFIDQLLNIGSITYLACCAVLGWFTGRYFIDRLKGHINFWKFW